MRVLDQRQIRVLERLEKETGKPLPRNEAGAIDVNKLGDWLEGLAKCGKALLKLIRVAKEIWIEIRNWKEEHEASKAQRR